MGGEITVESEIEKGSKFTFQIQVFPARESQISNYANNQKITSLAPDQPTYRILVAEDQATNRLVLTKLLKSLGFEVQEARNGQEAITIWANWQPQLIWMDMQMPVMDGYEATHYIRTVSKTYRSVIIALTASVFKEQQEAILAVGCDDFVSKPFKREELLIKMSQYLGVQYLYEEDTRDRPHTIYQESVDQEAHSDVNMAVSRALETAYLQDWLVDWESNCAMRQKSGMNRSFFS